MNTDAPMPNIENLKNPRGSRQFLARSYRFVSIADIILGSCAVPTGAASFLQQFRERLATFGLELHADKTRLIEFGRFAARNRKQRGGGKTRDLHVLGFHPLLRAAHHRSVHCPLVMLPVLPPPRRQGSPAAFLIPKAALRLRTANQ